MKNLTAVVEMTDNNLSAYIEGVDGIIAVGHDIEELKESMSKSIMLFNETCDEFGFEKPEELQGEYSISYKYKLCSFLKAYSKILSKSGLEQLTGINQKQLWHYASGTSKPKASTIEKMALSIREFGKELQSVEFA